MAAFKIGLRFHELAGYTFPLLFLHLRGYHEREDEAWQRTAWLGAITVNLWSKRSVTPDELLGRGKPAPMFLSKESFDAYMKRRIAKQEAERAANTTTEDEDVHE